ncbi:MAG: hypothetical protein AAGA48_02135 [Myxococcota bacterium]
MTWFAMDDLFENATLDFEVTPEEVLADLLYHGEGRRPLDELEDSLEAPVVDVERLPKSNGREWWTRFF